LLNKAADFCLNTSPVPLDIQPEKNYCCHLSKMMIKKVLLG